MMPRFAPAAAHSGPAETIDALHVLYDSEYLERRNLSYLHKIVLGIKPISKDFAREIFKYTSGINAQDFWGITPLAWASRRGDVSMVESLIACGADPEINDCEGFVPLHYATIASNAACLKILLITRANVHRRTKRQDTPLHWASLHQDERACVDLLVAAGADIDARGRYERTPLITAVFDRREDIASALLEYGADINLQDVNGWTALHFAIYRNVPVILDTLLRYKAYCAIKTKDCKTILHIAAYSTSVDMELIDILSGAPLNEVDIQAKDRDGNPAIDVLANRSDIALVLRGAYGVLFDNVARSASGDAGRHSSKASGELPEVEIFLDAAEYLDDTEPV